MATKETLDAKAATDYQAAIDAFIKAALVEDADYGTIKKGGKASLFQSGAQIFLQVAGLRPSFELLEHIANPALELPSGKVMAYYRVQVQCNLVDAEGQVVGHGFGAANSTEGQYASRPGDSDNTVLQMACKRALVAATRFHFGLAHFFTQDVEDMAPAAKPKAKAKAKAKPEVDPALAARAGKVIGEVSGGFIHMYSKFPGKCTHCGKPVGVGEEIYYNGHLDPKVTLHKACAAPWNAAQKAAPEPEPEEEPFAQDADYEDEHDIFNVEGE